MPKNCFFVKNLRKDLGWTLEPLRRTLPPMYHRIRIVEPLNASQCKCADFDWFA